MCSQEIQTAMSSGTQASETSSPSCRRPKAPSQTTTAALLTRPTSPSATNWSSRRRPPTSNQRPSSLAGTRVSRGAYGKMHGAQPRFIRSGAIMLWTPWRRAWNSLQGRYVGLRSAWVTGFVFRTPTGWCSMLIWSDLRCEFSLFCSFSLFYCFLFSFVRL